MMIHVFFVAMVMRRQGAALGFSPGQCLYTSTLFLPPRFFFLPVAPGCFSFFVALLLGPSRSSKPNSVSKSAAA